MAYYISMKIGKAAIGRSRLAVTDLLSFRRKSGGEMDRAG